MSFPRCICGLEALTVIFAIYLVANQRVLAQRPATSRIRLAASQFTLAENDVRGQLEAFATLANGRTEWRKACSSNAAIRQNPQQLMNLVCRELGYERGVEMTFGRNGTSAVQGNTVDFQSCPASATALSQCTYVPLERNTCGLRYYISVRCADQIPVVPPLVLDEKGNPLIIRDCRESVSFLVPPHAKIQLTFNRANIPKECRVTLVLQDPTNYLTVVDQFQIDARPVPSNTPCHLVSHVLIQQKLAYPDNAQSSLSSFGLLSNFTPPAASLEQTLCNARSDRQFPISPMATTISFIMVFKASPGALTLAVTLQARPQVELTCTPPLIQVSVLKPRLSSMISGKWSAALGRSQQQGQCLVSDQSTEGAQFADFVLDTDQCATQQFNTVDAYTLRNELLVTHSVPVQLATSLSGNAPMERSETFVIPIECRMQVAGQGARLTSVGAAQLPTVATISETFPPPPRLAAKDAEETT